MSFEVLRKEVQTLDGETFVSPNEKRLLINPEFVESMDNSDGSEQFSPEDQAIEDREMDNQNNWIVKKKYYRVNRPYVLVFLILVYCLKKSCCAITFLTCDSLWHFNVI